MRQRALHATGLVVASVVAAIGLQLGLDARGHAESATGPTSLVVYLAVVVALGIVAYAVRRAVGSVPLALARRQAAIDTVLLAVGGVMLWLVVQIVLTARECTMGTGC